ncbi:TetR/AcrR family transcriptional regulator [Solicola gregarius]|uniref:TetR/AcrR family transcriptional regulator n=1 Tax=Solicola gregarius TaxID=2908642 RepID=UPI002304E254|nr:TetR/AcrR family transcriptional regulator [Solicola gregarius]
MTPRKVLRAAARATPRRQEYSSSTRKALLENATRLFTERGYAGTSLDEIVRAARVTKGALYHHYGGKLDLFEDVFERAQKDASKYIARAIRKEKDPWARAQAGLLSFLEVCQEPAYRRLVMQEAPVALGPERVQEAEHGSTYGLVQKIVADLLKDADVDDDLRETFAHVFFGAMRTAGAFVADAEDAERASANVQVVILSVLTGLRQIGAASDPFAAARGDAAVDDPDDA